jgi:uncharacterized membrane protein
MLLMVLLLICIPAVFVTIALVVVPFLILGTLRDIRDELQTANRHTRAAEALAARTTG